MENLISTADAKTKTGVSTETTKHIRFTPVTGAPVVGTAYIIRSVAYPEYVMSYSAVAEKPGTPNAATSLTQNTEGTTITSAATDIFFENDKNYIYLDHSNRDNVLWIFEQYNYAADKAFNPHDTNYFGGTRYRRIRLLKGTYSETEPYWYAVAGNDATDPVTQYRFMNQRYRSPFMRNTPIAVDDEYRNNYAIEEISSGVYLIYYRAGASDYRVLTCDANGNWKVVRYAAEGDYPYSQLETDVQAGKLSVKLYKFNKQTAIKTIDFSGATTYNVEQGTTLEQALYYIQQNIAIRDNDRRKMAIPGSGDTAKVGYYWLDMTQNEFDSSAPSTYTFTIKYRNDDGTDTTIYESLTVNVVGIDVTGTADAEYAFKVSAGTPEEEIIARIRQDIASASKVSGSTKLRELTYSEEPREGDYYWLDFNVPYDTSVSTNAIYEVTARYRKPDGTDVQSSVKWMVTVVPLKFQFTGTQTYIVQEGVTEAQVRDNMVRQIAVKETTNDVTVTYAATPTAGCYWLEFDSAFDSSVNGDKDYHVNVNYRDAYGKDTLIETLSVFVEKKIDSSTKPNYMVGTVPVNAGLTTVAKHVNEEDKTSEQITFTVNGETRYVTVGLLRDNGNRVDTSKPGTYENLTVVYMDKKLEFPGFTLIVTESNEQLDYPAAGQGGYVGVDKQSSTTTAEFKEDGVADIQLSATGLPVDKGVDLIFIMDLSGSMLNEIGINKTAAKYENSRTAAMENALKDMIKTLAESGEDVTIAMADFGDLDHNEFEGSVVDKSIYHEAVFDVNNDNGRYLSSSKVNKQYEFTNHLNYIFRSSEALALDTNNLQVSLIGTFANVHTKFNMAHSKYTGVLHPTIYTGTGETEAGAFVDVDELYANGNYTATMDGIIQQIDINARKSLGTNYDIGLEHAYHLAYAKQQENIANGVGEERDVVVIFMSDGAAMQYNYLCGRSESQSWVDYLNGKTDTIVQAGYDAQNMPAELNAIAEKLLEKLQNGTLANPEYNRDNQDFKKNDDSDNRLYASPDANAERIVYRDDEGYYVYRMRYDSSIAAGATFYDYMAALNYDLDWEYLYAIARANGIEEFDFAFYTDPNNGQGGVKMTKLIDKLLDRTLVGYELVNDVFYEVYQTKLINPMKFEHQYYPVFTGEAVGANAVEKFQYALESIGVEFTWDLFAKLAYKHRATKANATDADMKALVTALKSAGDDQYTTYSPYSYFYNADGKNWWAEAIKGDPNKLYPVINKHAKEGELGKNHLYNGDVHNYFSGETTQGLALDGKDYISGFRGLGADIYTISFSISNDLLITAETAENVLKNVASGVNYFYTAQTEAALTDALKSIVGSMSTAATRAWYEDTMGEDYDLYIGQPNTTYANAKTTYAKDEVISDIHVYEYALDKNGNRVGDPIVRETVTFADMDGDGDVDAWSDQLYNVKTDDDGNVTLEYYDIWNETTNVISAHYFSYNANTDKSAVIPFGAQGTYNLPAETFFWVIGETEMVLDYPVYLTGSKEGTLDLPAGEIHMFDTNEKAILHYVNYLGNNCELPTTPPAFPWGNPTVGYAFYLVDENGTPLDSYGRPTTFAGSQKLTSVVYEKLNTGAGNNITNITAREELAATNLGETYQLYDPTASYTVVYNQSWQNNGGKTTYVTNYGGAASSNAASSAAAEMNGGKLDLEKTVVYFALMAIPKPEDDTVVIDFGLPVNIDVLANDGFAVVDGKTNADVTGVAKKNGNLPVNGLTEAPVGFKDTDTGAHGTMTLLESDEVQYKPDSMEMPSEDVFVYVAKDTNTNRYYYSTVTVIPATTIYYEDSFVSYSVWNTTSGEVLMTKESYPGEQWAPDTDGSATTGVQAQDRPGSGLSDIDADNIYGYDAAYTNCTKYSLGSAMKVNVRSEYDADGKLKFAKSARAEFDFWGTGFDVVSLTSNKTGTILVRVYQKDANGNVSETPYRTTLVDTYYGYKYTLCNVSYKFNTYGTEDTTDDVWERSVDGVAENATEPNPAVKPDNPENGKTVTGIEYAWIVDTSASDTLYQVPVMKIEDLPYGNYHVVISASYASLFDHQQYGNSKSYDFYLDAIRIYDPANDGVNTDGTVNETIQGAYDKDNEGWPEYFELRNLLISKADFDSINNSTTDGISGIVFIDNTLDTNGTKVNTVEDYTNFGPNNELYLAPGQAVAFKLNVTHSTRDKIHLAMKSVGGTAKASVYGIASDGTTTDAKIPVMSTATDLYYDITALNGKTVVIRNTGTSNDAILSVTNVKVTYSAEHEPYGDSAYFTITAEAAETAATSMMWWPWPDLPDIDIPEQTTPEETVPETTVPEETVPETTVPETEVPETTVPTEPEEDDTFEPERLSVHVSDRSVKRGSQVVVTVNTKADVHHITVNGKPVMGYSGSRWNSQRIWKVRITAEEAGQMPIEVIAYNREGQASEPMTKTVTVTEEYTNVTNWLEDMLLGFIRILLSKKQ